MNRCGTCVVRTRSSASSPSSACEPVRRRELGDGRREIDLERLPGDRGGTEQRELLGRERRELAGERRRDRGRHGNACDLDGIVALDRDRSECPVAARPPELLEIEGVPAAVAIHRCGGSGLDVREKRGGLRLRQGLERDPSCRGRRKRRREARRRLSRTERKREEDGCVRATAQQGCDELDRSLVAPVQVVEDDDEWPVLREELEERPRGAVRAVALVGDGAGERPPARCDEGMISPSSATSSAPHCS